MLWTLKSKHTKGHVHKQPCKGKLKGKIAHANRASDRHHPPAPTDTDTLKITDRRRTFHFEKMVRTEIKLTNF